MVNLDTLLVARQSDWCPIPSHPLCARVCDGTSPTQISILVLSTPRRPNPTTSNKKENKIGGGGSQLRPSFSQRCSPVSRLTYFNANFLQPSFLLTQFTCMQIVVLLFAIMTALYVVILTNNNNIRG